eukprot:SAG31_NODE_10144_length_1178_cov_1.650602_1_plen_31_part_10
MGYSKMIVVTIEVRFIFENPTLNILENDTVP